MALDTYANLQASMADWLNRADLVPQIPSFIALMEAAINKDPRARIQPSVVIATAQVANELTPVPADYIQMQTLAVQGSTRFPGGLELLTPSQIRQYRAFHQTAGEPQYYAIIGGQIKLLPLPDKEYTLEMEYYAKLPPLSDSNPTNWLLQSNPDVYLYGSLIHAEPYLKNDERVQTWGNLYSSAMEALNVTDDRALLSGATLKMRPRGIR